mmetsp:Transcript_54388/g.122332  ORF Transcript_54388/g.122332 Transcript_54388/m.122332 type:complete len:532 (-) Transcript_54388:155-1750(-)
MSSLVVERQALHGLIVRHPWDLVPMHKAPDLLAVLFNKLLLLLHVLPAYDALSPSLWQGVEHLGRVASRALGANSICHRAYGVDLRGMPEHAQVGSAATDGDVTRQGTGVASPHFVRDDHVRQCALLVYDDTGPRKGLVVVTNRLRNFFCVHQRVQAHHDSWVNLAVTAARKDAEALVLRNSDENLAFVPLPLPNELPGLTRHGVVVNHSMPAEVGGKILVVAKPEHAPGVQQPTGAAHVARELLRHPVGIPKLLGLELSEAGQGHSTWKSILHGAAQPLDHELGALLVGLARPHVCRRRVEDDTVEQPGRPWGHHVDEDDTCAFALSLQGHTSWVSAESLDVFVYPPQGELLVPQPEVGLDAILLITPDPAEHTQAEVKIDEYHWVIRGLHDLISTAQRLLARAMLQHATMEVDHDGKVRQATFGGPNVEAEAVLLLRDTRVAPDAPCTIDCAVTHRGRPGLLGLSHVETSRGLCIRDVLENDDAVLVHALDGAFLGVDHGSVVLLVDEFGDEGSVMGSDGCLDQRLRVQ